MNGIPAVFGGSTTAVACLSPGLGGSVLTGEPNKFLFAGPGGATGPNRSRSEMIGDCCTPKSLKNSAGVGC